MRKKDNATIGGRIQELRKMKGYSQTELANLLGKSLRTIQKYESGEIEVSIGMINKLAGLLDTTSSYLMGLQTGNFKFESFADIAECMFQLEKIPGLKFSIEVKRPPRADGWECSIVFNGKDRDSPMNADMCLFLEDWEEFRSGCKDTARSKAAYEKWKDETLAYHSFGRIDNADVDETTKSDT